MAKHKSQPPAPHHEEHRASTSHGGGGGGGGGGSRGTSVSGGRGSGRPAHGGGQGQRARGGGQGQRARPGGTGGQGQRARGGGTARQTRAPGRSGQRATRPGQHRAQPRSAHGTSQHPRGQRPPQHRPIELSALTETERYQLDFVTIGQQLGAPELAILAALCAGFGENGWDAHSCNSSGHCGVWQLSRDLQRQHDYTDVPYWTRQAYQHGFWNRGGLIALARQYSTHSAGYITNLCQGAYSNLDEGAGYYDKYLTEARATYAKFAGSGAAYGTRPPSRSTGAQPHSAYVNPLAHARVTAERIDQGVDYAGTGYLVAIADGVVTESVPNGSGWEGEAYLEYRITQPGELENAYIYYAEGITPVVSKGEQIRAGSRVADLRTVMPHGIELGFAAGAHQQSYYRYHDGPYDGRSVTRPGLAFSNLIERLGGPGGVKEGPVVGNFPEYIQAGEPSPGVQPGDVTTPPSSGVSGGIGAQGQFDWPSTILSAFVQIQRGAGNSSHHSHAAWFSVRDTTYIAKAD